MSIHEMRIRLVGLLSRGWAALRSRGSGARGGMPEVDLARDTRRAVARRRFWAELREGQLEAEARCSK
jgi:hypothetical protein